MQSILVFLKFVDVSRTQRVCHVIHMFFGSYLGKVQQYRVSALYDMSDRF